MKASTWLFAAAISVSGLALAQTNAGVTTITDPGKIAEIERHADQLKGNQPMMDVHHGKQHQGMRHHKRHQKAMHKDEMKEKAPSDTPMAPETKG